MSRMEEQHRVSLLIYRLALSSLFLRASIEYTQGKETDINPKTDWFYQFFFSFDDVSADFEVLYFYAFLNQHVKTNELTSVG